MIDKSRIKAEHTLEGNYLKLSCMPQERLDEIAMKVIKNDMPQFLVPVRMVKLDGVVELCYTVDKQIALQYKDWVMNKIQFLQLYRSLLYPFIEGYDWMLDYHYYHIDSRYIFINKNGKDVQYMYIPIETCRNTDDEILQYFKDIAYHVTIEDDNAFLLKLYQSFNHGAVTLKELYQMAEQGLQSSSGTTGTSPAPTPARYGHEPTIKKADAPLQREMPMPEKKPVQKTNEKPVENIPAESERDEVVNVLFGSSNKKSKGKGFGKKEKSVHKKEKTGRLFGGKKKAAQSMSPKAQAGTEASHQPPVRSSVPDYNYVQTGADDEVTQIEGMEECGQYLESMNAGMPGVPERIDLNFSKDRITIGRQSSDVRQPDIVFSAEHKRVGRMHACIGAENGRFYIVDLGSVNATILNGEILVPNQPYWLKNGDVVGFVAAQPIRYRVVL